MANYSRLQPNITPLNARIAYQIEAAGKRRDAAARHYRQVHARRIKRIKWIGIAAMAIFLIQLLMSQVRLHDANKGLTVSQQKLTGVQKSNTELKKDAKQLNDPAYLEQVLREKYGYAKSGETIYNLPEHDYA
ncbi:FtsB family cell division protein [Convivina intestini]|uniref:FtsB family cell division protein n=1 Tax=Convivina intestini TaxID=1505726 RepID=UPI00200DCC8B|nr:septum formation initiator family protein [Convivina intestini]CAH1855628.1 hypothetical protein R078131_01233 [Convivina intestini]